MIKYNAILYSFGKSIKDVFPKAMLRCKKNEEDIKQPTFYVEVRPLQVTDYVNFKDKLLNITVTYVDTVEDIEKLNEVAETLDDALNLGIRVDKTFLLFDKKNFTFSDSQDFLSLNITLSYKDSQTAELESDKYTCMIEELYFDYKIK